MQLRRATGIMHAMAVTMDMLGRLEQELERVKAAYEQYFMGNERREPLEDRKRIARRIVDAAGEFSNNTAVRFKGQQLKQKLITYEAYWNRINKQIEDGTYRRHRFKMQLHEQNAQARPSGGGVVDLSGEAPDSAYGDVIRQYREIQERSGQKPVAADKLDAMLKKQEGQLKQKYGAKSVQFRVVVEDGKPKLKAKPQK